MYIVVIGGGKIGYHLCKTLVADGHEVLVLEKDRLRCQHIAEELGNIVVRGDGCEATTQEEVGVERADMVIAVTGDDEDNLVACQVAKHKFHVPQTISLINDPRNEAIYKKLGVDVTVSTTHIILSHIEHELPAHPLVHLLSLKGPGLEIVQVKVPSNSKVAGKMLGEIELPPDSVVSLVIGKDGKPQVPTSDLALEPEDEVVVVTRPESEEMLRAAFTGDQTDKR
ncbi:MAG: TrkA family potassium uptake protein [Dehalococcoidia bacterium]